MYFPKNRKNAEAEGCEIIRYISAKKLKMFLGGISLENNIFTSFIGRESAGVALARLSPLRQS